jgi:hypothetical protein
MAKSSPAQLAQGAPHWTLAYLHAADILEVTKLRGGSVVHPEARTMAVDAKPEPLEIALGHSAVLVIDMQNNFGARGGMFDRAGVDIAAIERVVEPTAGVVDAARATGLTAIYLVMQFSADLERCGQYHLA